MVLKAVLGCLRDSATNEKRWIMPNGSAGYSAFHELCQPPQDRTATAFTVGLCRLWKSCEYPVDGLFGPFGAKSQT